MADLLKDGGRALLLGNEAITRGLIESGVRFASTYPGTPSSEVGNILERISSDAGLYFEFSVNEKVALETAAAAAVSGVRSFVFMKHVGLNASADPLMTLAYSGVRGGMLIMSADDPSAHSSQNEQDNRYYAPLALMPMIEPSTPAEAKDMVAAGYEISERLSMPVLFRTTTRVNHARGIVEYSETRLDTPMKGHFEKDDRRFVCIPANARINRLTLLERNAQAMELSETSPLNFITGDEDSDVGIITSGVGYTYVKEFISGAAVLKLGFTYPLPEKKIADFIRNKKRVIVVEELEPYLEDSVYAIMGKNGISVPVIGKRDGTLPRQWEFSPETMTKLSKYVDVSAFPEPLGKVDVELPARPPTLCVGCPHRGTFAAMKKAAAGKNVVYASDIGCYTLGAQPPFKMADFVLCMGGGVGVAGGFAEATDQKAVAFLGDSTFFHSGIPPLISAKFNNHKLTMVILDNRITAMTGQQPNPGTGRDFGGVKTESVSIEDIVRGIGIEFVEVVNAFDVKTTSRVMKDALEYDGVSVIISKGPCQIDAKKRKMATNGPISVDKDRCIRCQTCVKTIACPALIKKEDGSIETDPTQCVGCGMCASVCPKDAMKEAVQ
ncbi:MAG: indolepyruvate ferredoxin oxidoreductase subunit alpha [Candidatus Methanomethylophilaceae archaeon]|nr:indolepyruvate ferredoxin oxidoreductase subunit alpha [Candidatus Methanomethylophilaceae archaeon]